MISHEVSWSAMSMISHKISGWDISVVEIILVIQVIQLPQVMQERLAHSFELLCLRSIPSFSSPFSPLLSPTCASLKRSCLFNFTTLIKALFLSSNTCTCLHHWKGLVSSIFTAWTLNRVLFVKYPHFIEKGLASQFCTSLKRSSFSSMHNWKGLGF